MTSLKSFSLLPPLTPADTQSPSNRPKTQPPHGETQSTSSTHLTNLPKLRHGQQVSFLAPRTRSLERIGLLSLIERGLLPPFADFTPALTDPHSPVISFKRLSISPLRSSPSSSTTNTKILNMEDHMTLLKQERRPLPRIPSHKYDKHESKTPLNSMVNVYNGESYPWRLRFFRASPRYPPVTLSKVNFSDDTTIEQIHQKLRRYFYPNNSIDNLNVKMKVLQYSFVILQDIAVNRLQALWRGFKVRKTYMNVFNQWKAALCIQYYWKSFIRRKILRQAIKKRQNIEIEVGQVSSKRPMKHSRSCIACFLSNDMDENVNLLSLILFKAKLECCDILIIADSVSTDIHSTFECHVRRFLPSISIKIALVDFNNHSMSINSKFLYSLKCHHEIREYCYSITSSTNLQLISDNRSDKVMISCCILSCNLLQLSNSPLNLEIILDIPFASANGQKFIFFIDSVQRTCIPVASAETNTEYFKINFDFQVPYIMDEYLSNALDTFKHRFSGLVSFEIFDDVLFIRTCPEFVILGWAWTAKPKDENQMIVIPQLNHSSIALMNGLTLFALCQCRFIDGTHPILIAHGKEETEISLWSYGQSNSIIKSKLFIGLNILRDILHIDGTVKSTHNIDEIFSVLEKDFGPELDMSLQDLKFTCKQVDNLNRETLFQEPHQEFNHLPENVEHDSRLRHVSTFMAEEMINHILDMTFEAQSAKVPVRRKETEKVAPLIRSPSTTIEDKAKSAQKPRQRILLLNQNMAMKTLRTIFQTVHNE